MVTCTNKAELKQVIRAIVEDILNGKEYQILKERFRCSHKKAQSFNEDVMYRYYGINTNKNRPVLLEKVTLNRVLKKHGKNGMINISANRSDLDKETNDRQTKKLIADIKASGYSYLPTYGGYRGTDGIEDDYEPSFVVFNYGTDGQPQDFNELKSLALKWCDIYGQDSVLIKAPNENPVWLHADGTKANKHESDKYWKNDPKQEYFTSFKDKNAVNTEILNKLKGKYKTYCHRNNTPLTKDGFIDFVKNNRNNIETIGRRYTYDIGFDECYVNPMPIQLSERMKRKGEVMVWEV